MSVPASAETTTILARFARDVLLATGTSIRVRPSEPADTPAMQEFYDALSDRSAYFRFFGLRPARLDGLLHPADGQDVGHRVVLLALLAGAVIGIGEYCRVPGRDEVEAAFAVADRHQHEGIATVLVEDLAMIATEAGFAKLVAETLATNDAMLDVFRAVGLRHHSSYESGQVHVELTLAGESLLEDRSDSRDWRAAVASLTPVLAPSHVAVFGGDRDDRGPSPAATIVAGLVGRFPGRVSVIGPAAGPVAGAPTARTLADLDATPDLAVVVVPRAAAVGVIDECGRAGVKAAVVIAAGPDETGSDDVDHERRLLERARRYGMRLVGPASLGVMSAGSGLDATVLRHRLRPGDVAIASQSAAVGVIVADQAAARDLGIAHFVSLGAKVDISGNDLLRYWCDDTATAVVLIYMESIGDPRRFARVARAVARRKPVVALKSGRSAPSDPAPSRVAALAGGDAAVDALFAHTGVVRATSIDQLLDAGVLLRAGAAPRGRRVAVVGNAGGALVHAADAARARGLAVVALSPALRATLAGLVPGAETTANPVRLPAAVAGTTVGRLAGEIGRSGEVDACVVLHVDLAGGDEPEPLHLDVPDVAVPAVVAALGGSVVTGTMPCLPTAERAIDAVALAARRGEWLAATADDAAGVELDDVVSLRHAARQVLPRPLAPGPSPGPGRRRWLAPSTARALLQAVGVPLAPWRTARSAAQASRAARAVGFPCLGTAVLAEPAPEEPAAVTGVVGSGAAARRAYDDLAARYGSRLDHVVFQQQAQAGVELLIGGVRDDALGPLVVVAAGGADAEVLADRRVVLAPLTAREAAAAVRALRTFPLFAGLRGRPEVPVAPVAAVLERVGLLLTALPEVAEVDLQPTVATPTGCVVSGARVAVSPAPLGPLRALRGPPMDR